MIKSTVVGRSGGCCLWRCDLLKVVAFDGSCVVYVVERNGIYPTWNKAAWRAMPKPALAQQVEREVICK